MADIFKGYKGAALNLLKERNMRVWGDIEINTTRGDFRGILLPRSEFDDDQHIVVKLQSGYNIGIAVDSVISMKEVGYKEAH